MNTGNDAKQSLVGLIYCGERESLGIKVTTYVEFKGRMRFKVENNHGLLFVTDNITLLPFDPLSDNCILDCVLKFGA